MKKLKRLNECEWEISNSTKYKGLWFLALTESEPKYGYLPMADCPFYFKSKKKAIAFCKLNGFKYVVK